MTAPARPYRYARHLQAAGVLTLGGLVTALIYMSSSTPYTMILFLVGGQTMVFGAIALFVYVVVREVRTRLRSMTVLRFAQDEVIFHQGEPADHVFVIDAGEVEFVREDPEQGRLVLARLGPGKHFGELALLGEEPYLATARAATDVEVFAIHRTHFEVMYARVPHLRQRIDVAAEEGREFLAKKLGPGSPDGPPPRR